MFKSLLYLAGFIFVILLIIGNTVALTIFFGGILALSVIVAIMDRMQKKKKS